MYDPVLSKNTITIRESGLIIIPHPPIVLPREANDLGNRIQPRMGNHIFRLPPSEVEPLPHIALISPIEHVVEPLKNRPTQRVSLPHEPSGINRNPFLGGHRLHVRDSEYGQLHLGKVVSRRVRIGSYLRHLRSSRPRMNSRASSRRMVGAL
jgi:hypothetical protein